MPAPFVATVNASGLVSAVAVGTATITATSEGIDGTAAVTVTVVPIVSVLVAPATGNVTVGLTQQLTATPRDSINGALTGRIASLIGAIKIESRGPQNHHFTPGEFAARFHAEFFANEPAQAVNS